MLWNTNIRAHPGSRAVGAPNWVISISEHETLNPKVEADMGRSRVPHRPLSMKTSTIPTKPNLLSAAQKPAALGTKSRLSHHPALPKESNSALEQISVGAIRLDPGRHQRSLPIAMTDSPRPTKLSVTRHPPLCRQQDQHLDEPGRLARNVDDDGAIFCR